MTGYYVTARRDSRTAWLLGPFATHGEAERAVEDGRRLMLERDARAHFDGFGVARLTTGNPDPLPRGRLMAHYTPGKG